MKPDVMCERFWSLAAISDLLQRMIGGLWHTICAG